MDFIAERAKINASATLSVLDRVKELKRAGEDVISLSAGEPDFVTPAHIRAYAKQALDEGYTFYPDVPGIMELREAIAKKLHSENGIEANPKNEILVTVGGKEAIFATMLATVNPGDEVIVTDPGWTSYAPCIELSGGKPVYLELSDSDNFRISSEMLEKVVSPKTKMMIVNSPNNPMGTVTSKDELESIAELARRKRFLVLSDELYERIVFDGVKHYSIGSFDGMKDLTVTINGFSKTTAMTGWRIGYMAAPIEITKRVTAIHSHMVSGACTFGQRAAAQALGDARTEKSIIEMTTEYQRRRDVVMHELSKIKGISCTKPKGTFYAFPNISSLKMSGQEFTKEILERAKVAVVPGEAFGDHSGAFVRLSFATAMERLNVALERIQTTVNQIRR